MPLNQPKVPYYMKIATFEPRKPFIGIAGYPLTPDQAMSLTRHFQNLDFPLGSHRNLQIGVAMKDGRLPENSNDIFNDGAMNCLIFSDRGIEHGLDKRICLALEECGFMTNALQVNMQWPNIGDIANGAHHSRKNPEVILQLDGEALMNMGNNPNRVVTALEDYQGFIHHILLDTAGSKGMNADWLRRFLEQIGDAFPEMGLAVSADSGPAAISLGRQLYSQFPGLSLVSTIKPIIPEIEEENSAVLELAVEFLTDAVALFKH